MRTIQVVALCACVWLAGCSKRPEATQEPLISRPAGIASLQASAAVEGKVRIIAFVAPDAVSNAALSTAQRIGAEDAHWCSERAGMLVAEVTQAQLTELSESGAFTAFMRDELAFASLEASAPLIGAPAAASLGADGAGQSIAILDTGVAASHPFFGGRVVQEACFSSQSEALGSESVCPNGQSLQVGPGAATPCTEAGCEHGTHVAGIAAGRNTDRSGMAPAADIVAVQVFSRFRDREGSTPCRDRGVASPCIASFTSDQIRGLDYLLSLERPVAAANMSLGGGRAAAACDTDMIKQVIDDLRAAGTITVIAAGNNGFNGAVSRPGCVSTALTVGASDGQDAPAGFSNRGSLVDLWAPGVQINSSVPPEGFARFSGTSMAAPHVAGAIAALRSLAPTASAAVIEEALMASAVQTNTGPRLALGEAASRLRDGQTLQVADTGAASQGRLNAEPFPELVAQLQALPDDEQIRILAAPRIAEVGEQAAVTQASAHLEAVAKAAGAAEVTLVRASTGVVAVACTPPEAVAIARSGAAESIQLDATASTQPAR